VDRAGEPVGEILTTGRRRRRKQTSSAAVFFEEIVNSAPRQKTGWPAWIGRLRGALLSGSLLLIPIGCSKGPAHEPAIPPIAEFQNGIPHSDPAANRGAHHATSDAKTESPPSDVKINLEHILNGGLNRRGELVGMHHLPSAPKELLVDHLRCRVEIKQTSPGGPDDVVQAQVRLIDPQTGRVVREKFSTLYPASWTTAEITRAIEEAYADAERNQRVEADGHFDGHAKSGIRIDGYLTRDEKMINTAFPVYSARKDRAAPRGQGR
jgi:hypothetical protein